MSTRISGALFISPLLAAALAMMGLSFVFAAPAHADATCATVGGTLLVDHTMQVSNDPDSSVPGSTWALDTFTRHIQIWQEPGAAAGEYCAKADDSGSFTTNGTISPQNGYQLLSHITGTFSGGTYGKITGGTFSTSTDVADVDCSATPSTCSSGLTKFWTDTYFGGAETYNYGSNWGWTYATASNGTWVNAAAANTGDIYPVFDTTTATGYGSLSAAIAAANPNDVIQMESDASTTAEVVITKAITLDGNGHTLYPSFTKTTSDNNAALGLEADGITVANLTIDGAHGTSLHGINAYLAKNLALSSVTIENSGHAALVVNGSTLTATSLTTSGNAWGSVNVDPGSGVTATSSFTLVSGSLGDGTQIWSDGSHVSATAAVEVNASGYTKYHEAGTTAFYVWSNSTPKGATISGDSSNTLYSTIQAAISAASTTAIDTVNVGAGTYGEALTIGKAIVLKGAQAGSAGASVSTGSVRTGSESNIKSASISVGNVTLEGFTLSDTTGTQVSVLGSGVLSGITIANNIFSGYSNVGLATNAAGNLTVSGNYFANPAVNTEAMQIKNLTSGDQGCTGTTVTGNVFNAASNNGASDINLSCTGSNSTNVSISGNKDSNNTGGTSFVAFSGVNGGITVSGNTVTAPTGSAILFFGDVSGTATITGNTVTSGSSNAVSIHGGDNFAGVNDPQNSGSFSITNNTFTGNAKALNVGASMNGGSIKLTNNNLSGNSATASNSSTTTIDATSNWWGSASGPGSISGATTAPWYTDAAMTTLGGTTVSTSGSQASTTIAVDVTQTGASGGVTVTADIPAGTTITGNSTWDGTITAPTATTTSVSVAGFTTSIAAAIAVGSSNSDLTFDKAVQLTFTGQAGKRVGWYDHAGTFTEITSTCADNTQTTNDGLAAGGSCKIDVGADLVVWTKHFSTFVAYTQTAATSGGGSGGGGGGGGGGGSSSGSGSYIAPSTGGGSASTPSVATAQGSTGTGTGGQVLGAEAFQFAHNLTIGSTVADVLELQKVLTAEGFLDAKYDTGYFGGLTKAAVVKYQKAHGITPASGYVGPKTRTELNKGTQQTTPTTSGTVKQTLTDTQVSAILNLLSSFGADQATITNVAHALGK